MNQQVFLKCIIFGIIGDVEVNMQYYMNYRASRILTYDREKALDYAHKWAFKRNPEYFNYDNFGGDCTNFASQVIYSGSGVMNYTPEYGWYYINGNNRTPSWTGVGPLYNFMIRNNGEGPFAEQIDVKDIEPGDIIQISFHGGGVFNHSPVVVQTGNPVTLDNILVAAHTYDRDYYPVTNYNWKEIRCIHIVGIRKA